MPHHLRRTYPVVTLTLAALAAIGIAVRTAKPYLPPDAPNRLRDETAEFLVQGSRQQVDWRPLGEEAFLEARRTERPILLLIGASWSALSRHADREVFKDPDIEAFLARDMVCVRVDVQESPDWMGAVLPLQRSRANRDPGFQAYVLDPAGEVVADLGPVGFSSPLNATELLDALQRALDLWGKMRSADPTVPAPGGSQRAEADSLLSATAGAVPGFEMQIQALRAMRDAKHGGYSLLGWSMLQPAGFRYELRAGLHDELRGSLDRFLLDQHPDWLDGGFFDQVRYGGRRVIDFDKLSVANADLMEVFAEAGATLGEPLYREVARRAFDSLAELAEADGYPPAARLGDELEGGRSRRSSIPVVELRERFDPRERELARDLLGLRVETNPMMAPRLGRRDALLDPSREFDRLLRRLREFRPANDRIAGRQYCDVGCSVAARMIRTAVLLNDRARLRRAEALATNLDAFRADDDVRRSLDPRVRAPSYLGDYLAYADLAVQRFLAFGDGRALQNGMRVLRRAESLFASEVPGVWFVRAQPFRAPGPALERLPEVMDFGRDSCTATLIRVSLAYARLTRNRDLAPGQANEAGRWAQLAASAVAHFADESERMAFSGSPYFCAALDAMEEKAAFAVGRDPIERAAELSRLAPSVGVAPAIGYVREDLQRRAPGYYVAIGADLHGPLNLEEAAALLR